MNSTESPDDGSPVSDEQATLGVMAADLVEAVNQIRSIDDKLALIMRWRLDVDLYIEESKSRNDDFDARLVTMEQMVSPIAETWTGVQFLVKTTKWVLGFVILVTAATTGVLSLWALS